MLYNGAGTSALFDLKTIHISDSEKRALNGSLGSMWSLLKFKSSWDLSSLGFSSHNMSRAPRGWLCFVLFFNASDARCFWLKIWCGSPLNCVCPVNNRYCTGLRVSVIR